VLEAEGENEVSFFWEESGVPLKARLDKMTKSGQIIEIKTCEDARAIAFERSIYNFAYYLQAAIYTTAAERHIGKAPPPFIYVCIESAPPYAVAVHRLCHDALRVGIAQMRKCIDKYKKCIDAAEWPGYTDSITPVSLPQWSKAKNDLTEENT
jgi:exodeoxyribonuclease VIII